MNKSEPVRILYMEDDLGLARLVQKRMKRAGYSVDIANNGKIGLEMYQAGQYDVIAVDQQMPDYSGLEIIKLLASQRALPPTIMITGQGNELIAVEALKSGAGDYIVKDVDGKYFKTLPRAIERLLERQRLIEDKKAAEQALQQAHDELERRVKERTAKLAETNELLCFEIAERIRMEKKLAASNEELADFAYVVSHDLKVPLRGITQLVDWLSTDYAETFDEDGREMMGLLTGQTRRMYNLIEGVLQYSRIGRDVEKERKVDLNWLVQETIECLAPPENIHITIEDKLPAVLREQTRIGQVFQNLLSNALKFMDKPEGRICLGCVDEGTHWLFSVADNGPGIEEKYQTRIFQMFQTLTPHDQVEDTGIGLALVKKNIEKMWGGQVWVKSTVGEGSTFYFTLLKREEEK